MKVDGSHPQVARLDRTKPPPGYVVRPDMRGAFGPHPTGPGYEFACGNLIRGSYDAEAEATAAAWAHYECEHDPPGMETFDYPGGGAVFGYVRDGWPEQAPGGWDTRDAARAAAWAWYWRRVAVGDVIVREQVGIGERWAAMPVPPKRAWPRCLAWSDEQVAEVERWLAEGGAPPEVLR